MNVADFVQTTLEQIMQGTRNAQGVAEDLGGKVNPKVVAVTTATAKIQEVEFDVAVSATEASGSNAGLKVGLPGASVGVGGESDESRAAENRVRFTVLVQLPTQD